MYTPDISIVVSVYNTEKYLDECLASIKAQTFTNYEVLIINDGSKDSSIDICQRYVKSDCRFKLYNKNNGGISSARNLGIQISKGQYLMFFDSDDFWRENDFLEKLYKTAVKFDADIVRGELCEVMESGKPKYGYHIPKSRRNYAEMLLSSSDFFDKILCRDFFPVLSLYRTSIVREVLFDETLKVQEDIDFHIRMFVKQLRCIYLPICFYAYRKHEGSLTTNFNIDKLKYPFKVADIYADYSRLAHDQSLARIYLKNSAMMYYWTLGTLSEDPYFQYRKLVIRDLKLRDLQQRSRNRILKYGIKSWSVFISFVHPRIGVRILRVKNYFMSYVYNNFFNK